ncbi:unnamed protein product [Cuscuta campestris]|uniref:Uncharacterized protein n=1 Tax=Cuscuta campestris TaxID=132261 RepID=A0A484KIS8_9ASTE|nr:unnamed protein product [Cuscuta campestris]
MVCFVEVSQLLHAWLEENLIPPWLFCTSTHEQKGLTGSSGTAPTVTTLNPTKFAGNMTVGCPTGANVKTPVFGPSEGMSSMTESIFGASGVTLTDVAAVGPIAKVTGADPIVALDPTKVVIEVDPTAALDPKGTLIGVVCPTKPPNPAETFTIGVSELLPFPV